MDEKRILMEVRGFNLEAGISIPSGGPSGGAIICHPHPQYGGDMYNNVVFGVKAAFDAAGFATLRFNFRGVGQSAGRLAGPEGDTEDLVSIIENFRKMKGIDPDKSGLAGYSYGAMIALGACGEAAGVASVIALSPPVGIFPMEFMSQVNCPLLVITGDRDAFCPLDKIRKMIPPRASLDVIKGADHFYFGHEEEAGRLAASFLKERFLK